MFLQYHPCLGSPIPTGAAGFVSLPTLTLKGLNLSLTVNLNMGWTLSKDLKPWHRWKYSQGRNLSIPHFSGEVLLFQYLCFGEILNYAVQSWSQMLYGLLSLLNSNLFLKLNFIVSLHLNDHWEWGINWQMLWPWIWSFQFMNFIIYCQWGMVAKWLLYWVLLGQRYSCLGWEY